ncbi:Uncharacterised protein [Mycobacteroides abscessus subsp. abscessus]|nr:Uncharacterised protein [Mycobacteroides abscessus subsp. abscessus]
MQFGAHIQNHRMRTVEGLGQPAVGELGNGQRAQQLNITQATTARLQVGFGAVGDLATAPPSGLGVLDQFVQSRPDLRTPLLAHTADHQAGQLRISGDVPGVEESQGRRHLLPGHMQGVGNRPDTVIQPNIGVPQWVPQAVGHLAESFRRDVLVVQQHQIQV